MIITQPITANGPIIDVVVEGANGPLPTRALLDTGSTIAFLSATIFAEAAVRRMNGGLVTSHGGVHYASHYICRMAWRLDDGTLTPFRDFEILDGAAVPPGVGVILGRDTLRFCRLAYDGPNATFTLEF